MSRPPTRPNPLDPGMPEKIAERLIAGESMRSICEDPAMPAERMVYMALASNAAFCSAIARAREAQQDFEVERMIDIADAATPEDVHVAKLRIWARQWRAAKLAPKKYGEKLTAEISEDRTVRIVLQDHRKKIAADEGSGSLLEHDPE